MYFCSSGLSSNSFDEGFFGEQMPEGDPLDVAVLADGVDQDVFPEHVFVVHGLPDLGVLV